MTEERKFKIMVVDDDEIIVEMLIGFIETCSRGTSVKVEPFIANSIDEAISTCRG